MPVPGLPEIRPGDDLAGMIIDACQASTGIEDHDVLVVSQKVVSKAEGMVVEVDPDDPQSHKPLVLDESVRVVRRRGDLIISETKHGFVCASAGIDRSNVAPNIAALLPEDSDRSARRIRDAIAGRVGATVGIIVADTFGRPWRRGLTDVAIGCAGIVPILDLRGTDDAVGRELPGHRGLHRRRARRGGRAGTGQGDRHRRRRHPGRRPSVVRRRWCRRPDRPSPQRGPLPMTDPAEAPPTAERGTSVAELPPLVQRLPPAPDPDALLDGFVDFVTGEGISLYESQESAILELLAGNNVILNTPTGSGKSLVAAAAHFTALAADRRSVYTAPIKALVSEKFFALCRDFGAERVGMITGDASVNADAPIICCTAEILANQALRDGEAADVDVVIMDEFHYYADPQRGWAWQVPLLELGHCQFLLMSATLGKTDFFERELERRTGRETALVASGERPVPLDFEYRRTTLHQSISELLSSDRAPIYLVHFTQREATEAAQGYLSLDPLTKAEKALVRDAIGGFRFDSPVGGDLRRYLLGGVGVHHAGLLPKYRLLVEKLAQDGLLKIICGTDTLGVGVNVPIRSVLFTQLCKYDGSTTRVLSNREFAQIAGRAGRKGFDSIGHVWVQAPPHVVENLRQDEKAAADPKKRKKAVKKKPPERGYAHWTEDTFDKLVGGAPEPLTSSFRVNHQMILTLLDRPGDGCGAVRRLVTDNHETRKRQRGHILRAIAIYRSLLDADLLETLDTPDEDGRLVRVMLDLQDEFALHQPLSLWALEAIGQLAAGPHLDGADPDSANAHGADPDGAAHDELGADRATDDPGADDAVADGIAHALDVVSIIESVLESPGVVIASQIDLAKRDLIAELKAAGVEYEERMERLAEVEAPKPNKEWIYRSFDEFRVRHPWVGGDNVAPKSIVRDMFERVMTFKEYVQHYGLKRSEGVLLRYLSDAYRALVQNIPADDKTDDIVDVTEWLGEVVRHVDSSLIDEWERLVDPDEAIGAAPRPPGEDAHDVTTNQRAFTVMVRNEIFRWVELLARGHAGDIPVDGDQAAALRDALDTYLDAYGEILLDADARGPHRFIYDHGVGSVTQILADPDGIDEWRLRATVDHDRSRDEGRAVLTLVGLVPAA